MPIAIFLVVFGVFNWAELPLGWKDRTEQISKYLDNTVGLGDGWIDPILWSTKTVELTLGVVALIALLRRNAKLLAGCIAGWMVMFTCFAGIDIWADDRAELQEHTVYFVVFTQLIAIVLVVSLAQHFMAALRPAARPDGERPDEHVTIDLRRTQQLETETP